MISNNTPYDIEGMEAAIQKALKEELKDIPGYAISTSIFPDSDDETDALAKEANVQLNGALYVAWAGENLESKKMGSVNLYDSEQVFTMIFFAKSRTGKNGIYTIYARVKKALYKAGYKLLNGSIAKVDASKEKLYAGIFAASGKLVYPCNE